MSIFLSFVLLFHFFGSIFTSPEVCNPIECFNAFDTFFKPCFSETDCSCEKITKLERCARICVPPKKDSFILKGLQEVKHDLCNSYREFELENKCENKHKFRLLSCIYEKFQLEAEDPNANKSLLMCRQALDGQFCDVDSLPMCSSRQTYLSEVLLVKFFNPLLEKNCISISRLDAENLQLKPLVYMKDYNNLAECLDKNSHHVTDCVPQKWISTNVQDKKMFCGAVQSFLNCVESRVVDSKCNNQKNVFFSVRQSLFLYLLPHCSEQQSHALPLESSVMSDNNLNEVYSAEMTTNTADVTTMSPQNFSEVVVVHQHVVITLNYREKSAANQMCICHYLLMMKFFFIVSKAISKFLI